MLCRLTIMASLFGDMYYVYKDSCTYDGSVFLCWVKASDSGEKKAVTATHSFLDPLGVTEADQLEYLGIFIAFMNIDEWNQVHGIIPQSNKIALGIEIIEKSNEIALGDEIEISFEKEKNEWVKGNSMDLKEKQFIQDTLKFFAKSDSVVKTNFFESNVTEYGKYSYKGISKSQISKKDIDEIFF